MIRTSIRGALLGCASAFAIAPAFAQDEDSQADEIVVTGFKSSLENSVAAKRDNTSIVEAVSAEEIGKLPDVSIAESLGRLPGLATQRLNGRSNVLSIRGLGPDFSTALLNGREQVTTSDNRGVEFDQYPAELLSSALVYKTPYAGLIGQGLAGTVDLRTIRPLDTATVLESLKKTNRLVVVEEGWPVCSIGNHISAVLMQQAFDYLDAPVINCTGKDVPMPYAANLEKLALVTVDEIVAAVKSVCYR